MPRSPPSCRDVFPVSSTGPCQWPPPALRLLRRSLSHRDGDRGARSGGEEVGQDPHRRRYDAPLGHGLPTPSCPSARDLLRPKNSLTSSSHRGGDVRELQASRPAAKAPRRHHRPAVGGDPHAHGPTSINGAATAQGRTTLASWSPAEPPEQPSRPPAKGSSVLLFELDE